MKAVLFDLDDTLLQESLSRETAVKHFYHRCHAELSTSEAGFLQNWNSAIQKHFPRFTNGEISFTEHRRQRIRDVFGKTFSDAEADLKFAMFLHHYEEAWSLFPDVLPFLEQHRDISLGIVTNGQTEQQIRKLEKTGILTHFKIVVVSEEAGASKPKADIFHEACRRLEVTPQQCIFVGDTFDVDIVGSRAAGMIPYWLNRSGKTLPDQTVAMVGNLAELSRGLTQATQC